MSSWFGGGPPAPAPASSPFLTCVYSKLCCARRCLSHALLSTHARPAVRTHLTLTKQRSLEGQADFIVSKLKGAQKERYPSSPAPFEGYKIRFGFLQFKVDGKAPDAPLLAELILKEYSVEFSLFFKMDALELEGGSHPLVSPSPGEINRLIVSGRWGDRYQKARREPSYTVHDALQETLGDFQVYPLLLRRRGGGAPISDPLKNAQPPAPQRQTPVAAALPPPVPASWPELERLPLVSLTSLLEKPELRTAFVTTQVPALRDYLQRELAELGALEEAARGAEEASAAAAAAMNRVMAAEEEARLATEAAAAVDKEVQALANKFSKHHLLLESNAEVAKLEVDCRTKREALMAPAAGGADVKLSEAALGEFLELRKRVHMIKLLQKHCR